VRATEVERFLARGCPALVVISEEHTFCSIDLLELCIARKVPFVTIIQTNQEYFWPLDGLAARYRAVLPTARRLYFVSSANLSLFEKQVGCDVPNAEIICNPFNVAIDASPPWLSDDELRLACVGRFHPPSKGQHILLEALADPIWRSRRWCLSFYGEGLMRNSVERMVQEFRLQERVRFCGYVTPVEKIWAENHVLVMPSRYDGLPLAMVEAMLCSRPVVATDVGGHAEIVDDDVTGFLADAPTALSLKRALDRLWARRDELEAMGRTAAQRIREHVPADPVHVFAGKIKMLADVQ
jgi:glycosyltransferase involved in cell wall biosynthesis